MKYKKYANCNTELTPNVIKGTCTYKSQNNNGLFCDM